MVRHNYHINDRAEISKTSRYKYYRKARQLLQMGTPMRVKTFANGLAEEQADFLERTYISRYRSVVLNKLSGGRTGQRGKFVSEETKRKISLAKKGKPLSEKHKQALRKPHKLTDEGRNKLQASIKRGKDHYFYGKKMPEEQKEKIRQKKIGVKYSDEVNKKKGRTGKDHPSSKKYKLIDPNGNIHIQYGLSAAFCNKHGLKQAGLCLAVHRKNNTYKGWKIWLVE